MRPDLRTADERHEVRRAIGAWGKAGAIDEPTAERLRSRYRDDRRRARLAFRLLFFVLTVLAGIFSWGFVAIFLEELVSHSWDKGTLAVVSAAVACGAGVGTAWALGPARLRGFGVDEGLAALALGFGAAALGLLGDELDIPGRGIAFGVGLVVAAVASIVARRWGLAGSGVAATGGLLVALGALPAARLAWVVAGAAVALLARRWRHDDDLPVAHRRRATEAFVVTVVAVWLAAHPSHVAAHELRDLGSWFDLFPGLDTFETVVGWLVILVLPVLLLASGLRHRDRLELTLGALATLAAGASVVDALDLGPPWAVLLGSGLLLAALTWVLRRGFASHPERIWAGYTDRDLLGDGVGTSALEIGGVLAGFTPEARSVDEAAGYRGGGGEFGGGGASSSW